MHSSKRHHKFDVHTLYKHGTRAALAAVFAITLGAGAGIAAAQDAAPPPPAPNSQPDTGMAPNAQSDTPAPADQPMRHQPRADRMAAMTDADFAKEAAQGGMAEVKMGQLAQDKGTSDSVKAFGKRMVEDHTKAGDNLKAAAAQSSITLPDGISPKDQALYDRLSKMSGTDFDQAYARAMVRDHMHDIAAFRAESTNGKDANLKQFATTTLPTLQSHMKDARAMATAVGVQPGEGPGRRGGRPQASPGDAPPPPPAPQQ
jgi:putative membrane protein